MVKALLKPFGTQSFFIGLGIAAAAYLMAPQLRKSLKPVAVKGAHGMLVLGNQARELFNQGKTEEYANLANEIRQDREQYNTVLKELKDSILLLKDEISDLKGSRDPQ